MNKKDSSTKFESTVGCLTLIIIAIIIAFLVRSCTSEKATLDFSSVPEYEVIEVDDLSLGRFIRLNYYIKVSDAYTEEQIELIVESIVEKEKEERAISAIGFVLFSENDDPSSGVPSIGTGDWGPDGDWAKSMDVEPGDYSTHKYKFDFRKEF